MHHFRALLVDSFSEFIFVFVHPLSHPSVRPGRGDTYHSLSTRFAERQRFLCRDNFAADAAQISELLLFGYVRHNSIELTASVGSRWTLLPSLLRRTSTLRQTRQSSERRTKSRLFGL